MSSALRLVVTAVILVLLARSARLAWSNRHLALLVWRRIRVRHVAGSIVLLSLVVAVTWVLIVVIPATRYGLGDLVGLTGNAVFAPVEEAAARTETVSGPSAVWLSRLLTAGILAFLAALLALFPWLAYVEEQVFREGLEQAGALRRGWTALRFGLAHLIMLVPVAAALGIAVAGLWYGRVYLRAFEAVAPDAPEELPAARNEAVLASTVWHATANSLIVVTWFVFVAASWR